MLLLDYETYCLSLAGATCSFPFGEEVMVFKLGGKIFTLGNIIDFQSINVKCEPMKAIEQRAQYACIQPGWHMNKKHWNTIYFTGELTDQQVQSYIRDAYDLIFAALPQATQGAIREGVSPDL